MWASTTDTSLWTEEKGGMQKTFWRLIQPHLQHKTYIKTYLYEGTGRFLHVLRQQFGFLCIFDMDQGTDSQGSTASSSPVLFHQKPAFGSHWTSTSASQHIFISYLYHSVLLDIITPPKSSNDRNVLVCSEFNSGQINGALILDFSFLIELYKAGQRKLK